MTARLIFPLVVVAALLVGAAGALVAKKMMGQSAPATSTPQVVVPTVRVPTSSTSQSSSSSTSGATAVPGASAHPTAMPDPVVVDPATIRRQGYTPNGRYVWVSLGSQGRLYAWPATCTGSADGYCQKVFFFIGTRYLGTDTAKASNAIGDVKATNSGDIAVTYPDYKPNDPLCCPSGKSVTITYHWDGTKLIPSGTPPGH